MRGPRKEGSVRRRSLKKKVRTGESCKEDTRKEGDP